MLRRHDGGQTSLLVVLVVAVAVVALLVVGAVGRAATGRARARTAADAAALAAVAGGAPAADVAAERNGATVVWVRRHGDEVEVRVRIDDAEATSRARPDRHRPGP